MRESIRKIIAAGALISVFFAFVTSHNYFRESAAAANNERQAPYFEVDPFWPQPLPNKWILGSTIGVAVDDRDHVFIVHRNDDGNFATQEIGIDNGIAECCTAAPPLLEFDPSGSLVNAWGGPGDGTPGLLQIMALR